MALCVAEASQQPGTAVGTLPLRWCAAPNWSRPADGDPLPLVATQEPCAIRSAALMALAEHRIPSVIAGDAAYLGGTLNAVRAGLGITLLALAGPAPDGLIARADMPPVPPIHLAARGREGADEHVTAVVLGAPGTTLARVDRRDAVTSADSGHPATAEPAVRAPV